MRRSYRDRRGVRLGGPCHSFCYRTGHGPGEFFHSQGSSRRRRRRGVPSRPWGRRWRWWRREAGLAVAGVLLLQTLGPSVGTGIALDGKFFDPAWVALSVTGFSWIVRPRVLREVVAGRWLSWTWMVGPDCALLLVLAWSDPMPEPGGAESLRFGFVRPTAVALLPGAVFLPALLAIAALGIPLVSDVLQPIILHYLGNLPNVGFALCWPQLGTRWSRLIGPAEWLGRPVFV